MAIRIIKKGERVRTTYEVECYECGCVFEYNYQDTGFNALNFRRIIYCPQCGSEIEHEEEYRKGG